jgi:alkanesulfonate monooxygenase SsuD/methylene tetrahydromethanopterin reductase-like flavin-dependent oxidoreductase (luciferase family)
MTKLQFGFILPTDRLDTTEQTTTIVDLQHTLALVAGHFDSAWIIDHLQSDDNALLEAFTMLTYIAALHPQLTFGHTVLCQRQIRVP